MIGTIIIGFLTALLYCAIIILVAFMFVWGLRFVGVEIDGNVYKWGKVVIGLLCIIVLLTWLLGALGLGGGSRYFHISEQHRPYATGGHYAAAHLQGVLTAWSET